MWPIVDPENEFDSCGEGLPPTQESGEPMSNKQVDSETVKRVKLPEPDIDNITVLTEKLPNDPILPWHHYDSPWLGDEDATAAEGAETAPSEAAESADSPASVAQNADQSETADPTDEDAPAQLSLFAEELPAPPRTEDLDAASDDSPASPAP